MKWIFRIAIISLFVGITVGAFRLMESAVGYSNADLDRSVRMGSNGGPYLAGGIPK